MPCVLLEHSFWFHFLQKKPDWTLWEHSAMQSKCCEWWWVGDSVQDHTPDPNKSVNAHTLGCLRPNHSNKLHHDSKLPGAAQQNKLKISVYAKSILLWRWNVLFTDRLMFLIQFIARSLHRVWGLHCDEDCREAPHPFYSVSESLRQRLTAPRCHQCTDCCTPVSSHCHWQAEKAAGLNRPPAAHFPCSPTPPLSHILTVWAGPMKSPPVLWVAQTHV